MNSATLPASTKETLYAETGCKYSLPELKAAFEMVQNKDHWKGEIDAIVDLGPNCETVNMVMEAIEFYTGEPKREIVVSAGPEWRKVRLQAKGYWGGPCA